MPDDTAYTTNDVNVAAMFTALELTKIARAFDKTWSSDERAADISKTFKTIYAAVLEAQTAEY